MYYSIFIFLCLNLTIYATAQNTFNFLLKKISTDRMIFEGKKGAFPLGVKIIEDRRVEIDVKLKN